MTRYLTILATALFVACSGEKDPGDTGAGDDDDDCSNAVASQFPENGDDDVYYKTDVRLTLAVEDPSASIAVLDPSGAEVAGETTINGEVVTWSTDGELLPLTTYNVVLTYECGEATISWTTSDVGEPVGDASIVGAVFALDLAGGDWLRPEGVGPLLAGFLADTQILVTPTEVTASQITVLGAIGDPSGQDVCSPTIEFPPANWFDPYFELSSPSLELVVADIAVNIEELELSGAFAPDGSRIQGTSLGGSIDTRALVDLVEEGGEDNAVCLLVESLGVACEECTDGSGPFCLTVYVDSISGDGLPGQSVVPRTDAEIDADPACAG